ncbi:MAG TPA: ADOP family duplicated permease [Bryobacteraceae bacterium]|jgi:predicted permease|nr:ADOP family duplicated permease [Bryobacteraceae bacterium]
MSDPPKFAESLLRRLVGGRDADAVAGDLRETFEARGASRLWYWGQVLSCFAVRFSLHRRALPGIGTDFSRAVRRMRRNPGYALTAMLCLALALGVNTTLFSFLDSMYFRKLPVPDAGRIVEIRRQKAEFCTAQNYFAFRDGLRSVQAAAVSGSGGYMEVGRTAFVAQAERVSSNYARVLRLGTTLGAWFGPESESAAEPPAVIGYRLWKTRFAGDPSIIGTRVRVMERDYRIVGVARPEFTGTLPPMTMDVWLPLARRSNSRITSLVARMAPGENLASVRAEMRVISARLQAADPADKTLASPLVVQPDAGFVFEWNRTFFLPILTLLSAVSGMVLLIACVNVANLLLSRATVRQREIAIRQSLGASRPRLFRETFAEGLLIAAGGLALGILIGYWSGRALELFLPSLPAAMYHGLTLDVDWRVALFLAAAGIASAILFSLPPAMASSRRNLNPAMKGDTIHTSRQRELYSVVQVALSLTLLIATGLLLRALDRAQHVDPGFASGHRVFVNVRDLASQPQMDSLVERVRELAGVEDATLAGTIFPNTGVDCVSAEHEANPRQARSNIVDPNYFDFMRIPIVKGSGFAPAGSITETPRVILNETMARNFWPDTDPVGKTIWLGCPPDQTQKLGTVIGIARDTKYTSMVERPMPMVYVSRREDAGSGFWSLIVRTAGEPHRWIRPVLDLAQHSGGSLIVYDSGTLDDAVAQSLWEVKWQASLLAALGLLAIVLAAIGVYGVVACSVAQRTREIGIRMALGAVPLDVQWMVLAHGLRVTAIGIAAGLLLSAFTVRLLRGFLYGLSPFDPIAFAAASLAWIAIAVLASWYPARRATRVDPLTALNYE